MANLTIYVPDDLASEVRRHDINVSHACQVALRRKVRLAKRHGGPLGTGVVLSASGVSAGRSSKDPAA